MKRISELMKAPECVGSVEGRCTLHRRSTGINKVRDSESESRRLADHMVRRGKAHI